MWSLDSWKKLYTRHHIIYLFQTVTSLPTFVEDLWTAWWGTKPGISRMWTHMREYTLKPWKGDKWNSKKQRLNKRNLDIICFRFPDTLKLRSEGHFFGKPPRRVGASCLSNLRPFRYEWMRSHRLRHRHDPVCNRLLHRKGWGWKMSKEPLGYFPQWKRVVFSRLFECNAMTVFWYSIQSYSDC